MVYSNIIGVRRPIPESRAHLAQYNRSTCLIHYICLSADIRVASTPFIFKLITFSTFLKGFKVPHWGLWLSTLESYNTYRGFYISPYWKESKGFSPPHRSSCLRQQHSAGRCFFCCRWHSHQLSHTRRGPALLQSRPGWFVDIVPGDVCLPLAVKSGVAVPPLRSRFGGPCREGAGMSRCAHCACLDSHLCLEEKTFQEKVRTN